jgi:hypothetical protein
MQWKAGIKKKYTSKNGIKCFWTLSQDQCKPTSRPDDIYVCEVEQSIMRKLLSVLDTRHSARKHKKGSFLAFRGTHTHHVGPADHISIRPVCFMYIPDMALAS